MVGKSLPSLNALRAFEAAARHMSFTRAAEELAVTPGAVSQQIRTLEDYLGGELFERDGRTLRLSEAGRAAQPYLHDGFESLVRAVALMRRPARRLRLTVSAAPSFASKWLAPRLHRFQEAHPEIEVWISADTEFADLAGGAADLAIRYGAGVYEGLSTALLLRETVLPVCSPRLLEGPDAIRLPADLAAHTLLHDASPESAADGPDWPGWLAARGLSDIDGGRGPRFNLSALVIDAAAAGRGVALAKRSLAQIDLAAGRLATPFADGGQAVSAAYYIVTAKNRAPTAEARHFIAWLFAEARDHENSLDEL